MASAGCEFKVIQPKIAEIFCVHFSLAELTILNAARKARAVAIKNPADVILAADTLIALEGELIGKPRDLQQARQILQKLSGRVHDVCTGVCLISPNGRPVAFAEFSRVTFRRLSENLIAKYFRKVNPLDKAGAYAAQSESDEIIASVEGSFTNVIGLPMERLSRYLKQIGGQVTASRLRSSAAPARHAPVRVSKRDTKTKR